MKESVSRLEESELRASKKSKHNKNLEEELLMYKKEALEQHENGFHKAVRKVRFFIEDLDLGLFDPIQGREG